MRLSLAEVLRAIAGVRADGASEAAFSSYHTDSREVLPGGLFFALRGAAMDGARFVPDALERGAAGVVVEASLSPPPGAAVIRVASTWDALYALSAAVLQRVSPLVVGVTGSNGKTSTKEMAAAVLEARHRVLRTTGNLNTETGLPLTLLRLEPDHTAAVLEMGMQKAGEIARLAALARPAAGVVTGVGSVHAEFFADGRAGIARAKGELLEALPPAGLAVINADDDFYEPLRRLSRAPVLGFGLEAGEFRGDSYRALPEGGSQMVVAGVGVRLRLDGRHQARNALAALAVGRFGGVSLEEGAARLAGVSVDGRLQRLKAAGGYTIVDDAYNASPESMLAAFDTVAEWPRAGRLLGVLGEMRELGGLAEEAHLSVGRRAGQVFDRLAVVESDLGRLLAAAARADLLADAGTAVAWVRENAAPGDVVLLKASHGVDLHRVVGELTR